jgi:phosphatidylglycerophosphate synthase
MLDAFARRLIDPPLNGLGQRLARAGVSANHVTLAGLAVGLLGALAIIGGAFWLALMLILGSRFLDGLDGATARAAQPTDFGGYLDIVSDFLFYGAVPLAFVIHNPEANAIAGAVLLTSFYFNGASFLGYAALAAKRGIETRAQGIKSLYFSNGLLEGTETIAFFVALCLWPHAFAMLAYVFGTLCFLTAILRLCGARHLFS